ncbi:AAA family ATPase [Natroniella sulfidigena]|uniref:FtsK/SpoIIIE domain-containing protein n=1 Tax=Natroniella sulfidigena TaxID=723921 RepID=UPI00200B647D|nr:FtsK/SpoIIIE domain-containing protein [Natroniella sulfidigena]MCK8818128.1 AAA family ATPase [Natroniella sulfidigena]
MLLPSSKVLIEMLGWSCIAGLGLTYYLEDTASLTERIVRDFFVNSGLYIKTPKDKKIVPKLLAYEEEGEDQELLTYKIPNGLGLENFQQKKKALEHQLNGELEIWAKGNRLHIRLYSSHLPEKAIFTKNLDLILEKIREIKLGLSIGFSRKGYIVNDFSSATCHVLLGGETGSGKSVLLRQLILSGMLAYTHHQLHYYFVDLKGGIEMIHFKEAAHTQAIAENEQDAFNMLVELNNMVDQRLKKLKNKGATSLYQLKNNTEAKVVLVVDELAELQNNDDCLELLERLLRLARATGIHIVAATQRPDRKVLPGQLKANLPVSVAMKCKNEVNSSILLDDTEAAYIEPVAGRGIYQLNQNVKIQVPYVNVETTKKLINERNKELGYSSTVNRTEAKTSSSSNSSKVAKKKIEPANNKDDWGVVI